MIERFEEMFEKADAIDLREGALAYFRYNDLMRAISERYSFPLDRVVAVFVSLSPNNDYHGNLRSLVSVLDGINRKLPLDRITVSTYRHCAKRAYAYAIGEAGFLDRTKGPKVINFYHNVLQPEDVRWVTIDGHMSAIWQGKNLNMKEAIVKSRREYNEIASAAKALAFRRFYIPNQYQAILWFTRKRVFNVKYQPQMDLLFGPDDVWRTSIDVDAIRPYPPMANPCPQEPA